MTNAFVRVETGKVRRGSETFAPKKKEEGGEGNPRGRRVPSPQGSRIFLSRGPVQASSLGCVSFHSCRVCTLQRLFPAAGIRQLLVLVPGPKTV